MDLFEDLQWRGLAHQWTGEDALPERLRAGPITLYAGFDPSAASLHHGNLVGLILLRRFQAAGHRVIALAGGATGMIGDPTGRTEERAQLTSAQVEANLEGIRTQMERFIELDKTGARGVLVNNADWFASIGFLDFLRDVGFHASVNVMLARESVKARMASESGISFSEFSYQLIQGYDFVHLHDTYGCELQTGGSDQFGNIVAGVDLGRRMRGAQLFGLTTPLLTRSDGAKFGKTAEGAVWLDPERTSPYAFYQWFVRLPDDDVPTMLRVFTELGHEEILELESQAKQAPERREAQRRLAQELTILVHGKEGWERAERATHALFGGDLDGLAERELLEIFADVPSTNASRARLASGIPAIDLFVETGLAKSKADARRLLAGGGAYVNNRRLEGEDVALGTGDLLTESVIVLRAGKRSFALVRARD
jgi:tyrosyl-tRNA synthetase